VNDQISLGASRVGTRKDVFGNIQTQRF
jgi:hypothetical protein